jgi:hypothetical protein
MCNATCTLGFTVYIYTVLLLQCTMYTLLHSTISILKSLEYNDIYSYSEWYTRPLTALQVYFKFNLLLKVSAYQQYKPSGVSMKREILISFESNHEKRNQVIGIEKQQQIP